MPQNSVESYLDRTKPPIAVGLPNFTFNNFESIELNASAEVHLWNDNSQPMVFFNIILGPGSYFESIPGLARITANMLGYGSEAMHADEFGFECELLGINIRPIHKWDNASITMNCLADNLDRALDLMFSIINYPGFRSNDLIKEKSKYLANLRIQNSDPSSLANNVFWDIVHEGTPYDHNSFGNTKSIESIAIDDVINHYHKIRNDGKIEIIASGNFDKDKLIQVLNQYTTGINTSNSSSTKYHEIIDNPSRILVANKSDANQAVIYLGYNTISRNHTNFQAYSLSNIIFGGYFLSRLNEQIREVKGLTYGIHSNIQLKKYLSTMVISSSVNQEAVGECISEVLNEIDRMNKGEITESELNTAKQYYAGNFVMVSETPSSLSKLIATIVTERLPKSYFFDQFNKLRNIDIHDLQHIKQYYSTENLAIGICGNSSVITPQLHQFGKPEIAEILT